MGKDRVLVCGVVRWECMWASPASGAALARVPVRCAKVTDMLSLRRSRRAGGDPRKTSPFCVAKEATAKPLEPPLFAPQKGDAKRSEAGGSRVQPRETRSKPP